MTKKQPGTNYQDIKLGNRSLVLRLIATNTANTRVNLANITGLSKMAIGNIVAELLAQNMIEEVSVSQDNVTNSGRPAIALSVSDKSPKICGFLIKRGLCQAVLSDLSGKFIKIVTTKYSESDFNSEKLIDVLKNLYSEILICNEKILAVGISSLGPLNISQGTILEPPNFYGISNLNIVDIISQHTGLPTFLINDANAGALAEKLYGKHKLKQNFIYLHIMNGIGSGLVLEDALFNGNFGQSGEIGHTSINFSGPPCSCGNNGCLDLYANINAMRKRSAKLSNIYPNSKILGIKEPTWENYTEHANNKDPLSIAVLDEFCEYLSYAVVNTLNLLDLSTIIIGYNAPKSCTIVEDLLHSHLTNNKNLKLLHSSFLGDAPLVGSVALIADKVFNQIIDFN